MSRDFALKQTVFGGGALGMDTEGCNLVNRLTHGWVYYLLALLGAASLSGVVVGGSR